MKKKLLLLLCVLGGLTNSVRGQMDSWMLNQWLNQMNMDTYQQQQKITEDFMNLLDAESKRQQKVKEDFMKLIDEGSKRQEANAMATCLLLPGGVDIFFAHIRILYISTDKIEVIHRFTDMTEEVIPSSSYFAVNGEIVTNSVFKPGHAVIVRRKDTGKVLSSLKIPLKYTSAYQVFLRGAQQAAKAYGANTPKSNYSNPFASPGNDRTKSKQCSLCKGKGWIAGSKTPVYGTGGSYWCDECGREVNASHSHDRCPSCGGSGKTY